MQKILQAQSSLKTPILFLVFNRPEPTKIVFAEIRRVKPEKLYIAGDGPRSYRPSDEPLVKQVQEIFRDIDWPCEVKTLFQERNRGCKLAISNALSWFFENEEQGIILEDDCLPSQSFFYYCEKMLDVYKDDLSIGTISGNLRIYDSIPIDGNLFKSIYFNMWGWATWRRTWQNYEIDFFKKEEKIKWPSSSKDVNRYWENVVSLMAREKIDTWDYQLMFQMFKAGSLTIYPKLNLVKNLGFGLDATHTKNNKEPAAAINHFEWSDFIDCEYQIDKLANIDVFLEFDYQTPTFYKRVLRKILRRPRKLPPQIIKIVS